MNTDRVSFGAWVRALRRQHDLTQNELGGRVGCTEAFIRKIETDERRPSVNIAERLAACLGILPEQRDLFIRSSRGDQRDLWLNQPALIKPGFSPDRHRLEPMLLTEMIGREQELEDLHLYLLRSSVQLLTLTGPPGVGKTRLAHALGQKVQESFTNGAVWISLIAVQQPDLLLTTIAQSLDAALTREQQLLPTLISYLRSRHILLLLDNFEQLVAAAPILSDLLRAAPKLKILVTSQVALHLSAEHEFSVAPLPHTTPDNATFAQAPAVQLFVQRAQAVNPAFKLTPANTASVVELCRRLDGLPLAIELAAARCKIFSAQMLLERLDQRLSLLHHVVQDHDNRHHSLYAAIDWSYSLLNPPDRLLFSQLSVFTTTCTLSAIETICRTSDEHDRLLIDRLTALVDHSLLQRIQDFGNEPCFAMLESVRMYAAAQLNALDDQSNIRHAHADYYLHITLTDAPVWGQDQPAWVQRIDENYTNILSALSWSYEQAEYTLATMITTALTPYWIARGLLNEGRAWAERLLVAESTVDELKADLLASAGKLAFQQSDYEQALIWYTASLELNRYQHRHEHCAQALYHLGWVAIRRADYSSAEGCFHEAIKLGQTYGYPHAIAASRSGLGWIAREQGDYRRAQELHEQSLDHYRTTHDISSIAYTLNTLGWMIRERGDYAQAQRLHEESFQLYRGLQHRKGMAHALNNLGWVAAMREDTAQAQALMEESLALRQQDVDRRAVAWSLNDLGWVIREQGDYVRARILYEDALAIYQDIGDRRGIANMYTSLGLTAVAQQEYSQAQHFLREGCTIYAEIQDWRGMARCLDAMAFLATSRQQSEQGARLLGVAEGLRARISATVLSHERRWYDSLVATVFAEEAAMAATWMEQGRLMSLTAALAEVLPFHVRAVGLPLTDQVGNPQPSTIDYSYPPLDASTPTIDDR